MQDHDHNLLSLSRGVIHVGANTGQERHVYDRHGLKVVWIEALPDVFEQLARNIAEIPRQLAVRALVTDMVGQKFKFRISNNNAESSSILELAKHREIWPEVDFVGSVDLVSTTLDQLLLEGAFDLSGIDSLILDTQGSELLVLKGAERVLTSVRRLKVEAADFEAYEGCARADEIESWLRARGFVLAGRVVQAQHPEGGRYFELFFERALEDAQLLQAADAIQLLANDFASLGLHDVGSRIADAASLLDDQVPEPVGWWSSPFNGQAGRRRVVEAILRSLPFRTILETGTFRGTTTRFFAENFSGPVYSCELDRRWFATARRKLAEFPAITVELGDSRDFLARRLSSVEDPLFLYLDAHWNPDLPLIKEIELVLGANKDTVIVIDDFEVPGDPGYGFDDYGPGRRLTTDILASSQSDRVALYFPDLPSCEETGAKRGCAVIATGVSATSALDRVVGLRRVEWPKPAPFLRLPPPRVPRPGLAINRLISGFQFEREHANGLSANTINICIGHEPFRGVGLGYVDVMISPVDQHVDGPCKLIVANDARLGSNGHTLSEFSQLIWLSDHFDEITKEKEFIRLIQYRKFISSAPCGAVSDGRHFLSLDSEKLPALSAQFRRRAVAELVSKPLHLQSNLGQVLGHFARFHKIEDFLSFGVFLCREAILSDAELAEFVTRPDLIPSATVGIYRRETLRDILIILARAANFVNSPTFVPRDGEQRRSAGFLLERLHSHLLYNHMRRIGQQIAKGDLIILR